MDFDPLGIDDHVHTEHQSQLEMGEKAYHCHLCDGTDGFLEFFHLEKHLRYKIK
jgi:hypothetical protein